MISPIIHINSSCNNSIYIKRDDLLPFSFGGNKYRIGLKVFEEIKKQKCDCVIGYGSSKSNFCRIIANMAKLNGIKCYIICSSKESEQHFESFNQRIIKDCGAEIVYCSKQSVSSTIKYTIEELKKCGLNPYYINGNEYGIGNEKTLSSAYVDAYGEIVSQERKMGVKFDYIFLPVGTGMTIGGLVVGKEMYNSNARIVGISIARDIESCVQGVMKYINANDSHSHDFEILDDYLIAGYGTYDKNIEKTIMLSLTGDGIPLDPVYTGKAFFGMQDFLKTNNIENKNILFLHTGGTPLFFDYIEGKI